MNSIFRAKKKSYKFEVVIFLLLLFLLEFLTIHISTVKTKYAQLSGIDILKKALENIEKSPFDIVLSKSVLSNFWSMQPYALGVLTVITILALASLGSSKGKFAGIEHGSAEWAKEKDILKFKKVKTGIVLGEGLYMDPFTKEYNLNQLVIGGPGSGKSFRKIKPDILQTNSNYVITDSKGEIFKETSKYLISKGYKIKVLNLISPKHSMKFNPFKYIKEDKDVLILAETFINNTDGENKNAQSNDTFWKKAETALLQALIFYIYREVEEEDWTFKNVLALLLCSEELSGLGAEDKTENLANLDQLFGDLEKEDPGHEAVKCYKIFRLSAGETAASILVGLAVRFSIFVSKEMEELVEDDEIELQDLCDKTQKVAVYVMIPDSHRTFDVISAMFFSQLFQYLIYEADFSKETGALDIHCRVLMDEFINIGQIPYFDNFLSTIRSRNISATIIVQEINQLKSKYKHTWETIIGCCDTMIYMGSPSNDTRDYVSKILGKTTAQKNSKSINYGQKGGRSESIGHVQRELMTPDELRVIPDEKQITIIRALNPIYIDKFKTESKPFYKYLSDRMNYTNMEDVKLSNELTELAGIVEEKLSSN